MCDSACMNVSKITSLFSSHTVDNLSCNLGKWSPQFIFFNWQSLSSDLLVVEKLMYLTSVKLSWLAVDLSFDSFIVTQSGLFKASSFQSSINAYF